MVDNMLIQDKCEEQRIGRNEQGKFWCGFCLELIRHDDSRDLETKFRHISDHLKEGRTFESWYAATADGLTACTLPASDFNEKSKRLMKILFKAGATIPNRDSLTPEALELMMAQQVELSEASQPAGDDGTTMQTAAYEDSAVGAIGKGRQPELNDTDNDSDASSLPSIFSTESLSSGSVISSLGSSQELVGAAEELAALLLQDEMLQPLCEEALGKLKVEKFEKNLGRLLRKFALDLKVEASGVLERSTASFIIDRAKYVARCILSHFGFETHQNAPGIHDLETQPAERQRMVERYLQHQISWNREALQGPLGSTSTIPSHESVMSVAHQQDELPKDPPEIEYHQSDSDESDIPLEERVHFRTLEGVKAFILESRALQNLRQNLSAFLTGPNRINTITLPSLPKTSGIHQVSSVKHEAFTDFSVPRTEYLKEGELLDLLGSEEHIDRPNRVGTPLSSNLQAQSGPSNRASLPVSIPPFLSDVNQISDGENSVLGQKGHVSRFRAYLLRLFRIFRLAAGFLDVVEKPLASDNQRIRWTCVCGTRLYDDFREISPDSLTRLQDDLNNTSVCQATNMNTNSQQAASSSTALEGAGDCHQTQPNPEVCRLKFPIMLLALSVEVSGNLRIVPE